MKPMLDGRSHPHPRGTWRLALAAALLVAGCAADAERRVQGRWVRAESSVELFADGRVVLRTPRVTVRGSYTRRPGSQIRVRLGTAGRDGGLYARERGGILFVCQLQNYRHCMQFHRPGRPVALNSR
jgi:hypothetical protein